MEDRHFRLGNTPKEKKLLLPSFTKGRVICFPYNQIGKPDFTPVWVRLCRQPQSVRFYISRITVFR